MMVEEQQQQQPYIFVWCSLMIYNQVEDVSEATNHKPQHAAVKWIVVHI